MCLPTRQDGVGKPWQGLLANALCVCLASALWSILNAKSVGKPWQGLLANALCVCLASALWSILNAKSRLKKETNKQTQRKQSFGKQFSHSTCSLERKVLVLYIFHWSFIHVLIVSQFFKLLRKLFFLSRTASEWCVNEMSEMACNWRLCLHFN